MTPERAPWYLAGPLLGLAIVALRATLNRPFGALGGYVEMVDAVRGSARPGYRMFLLAGFLAGGVAYALTLSATPGLSLAYPVVGGERVGMVTGGGVLLLAGIAMGFGARTAGGCTSGHGMTGVSIGSPASLLATATFFATAVAIAHLVAWAGGAR